MRIFQPTVTGSNTTTGSLHISGPVYFYTLETSSVFNVLTYNTSSGQVFFTSSEAIGRKPSEPDQSIQFNDGGEFSGSANFTFNNNVIYLTGSSVTSGSITLTGSMFVSGTISASFGPNTVGFFGTASWAQSASQAISSSFSLSSSYALSASYSDTSSFSFTSSLAFTSSFITASNVWGPFGSSSITSASYASGSTSASYAATASFMLNPYPINVTGSTLYSVAPISGIPSSNSTISSIFFGTGSGLTATNASQSVFLGEDAGRSAANAHNSNFLGNTAGRSANNARYSNFLGAGAGFGATNARNSNFLGLNAGSGSINARNSNFLGEEAGISASNADNSNFLGNQAGQKAANAYRSNFLGIFSGVNATNADNSNFLGDNAGWGSTNARLSNFIGAFAGGSAATNASQSNFLGFGAGQAATNAHNSNFIGYNTGRSAINAPYSTLIGYQVGYATSSTSIGSNNIIIGTNITLSGSRKDSINIGGIIFGTGSYATTTGNPFSGSAGGRIGINIVEPTYNLHVSGTVAFPNLTTSSQVNVVIIDTASGQLFYTASNTVGGGGSGTPTPPGGQDTQIQFNSGSVFSGSGNFTFNYVNNSTQLTGSAEITGSLIISGGFFVQDTTIDHPVIDSSQRILYGQNGYKAIDWNERFLYADDGTTKQIEWWDSAGLILPSITTNPLDSILGIDASGRVCYTASNAIGGGGSGTPGGSNKQIQFNANGTFSGSNNFTFDSSSNTIEISGSLTISGSGTFTNIGPARFTGSIDVSGSVTASIFTGSFTGSLFGTASYVTGALFTDINPALSASYALTASFSPNFANTNLTLTNTRTHTGGGFEYRFFNSGSALDYKGGNQLIRSYDHVLGVREPKGGGNYETAFIQMTTSSLVVAVGDENNAYTLKQVTVTTSSIILTGSLNVSGSITGSLFGTSSWATNALTASFWGGYSSTSSFVGNGSATSFNINHGFNTLNLHITVYSASGTYENVYPDIRRVNANTASIVFANPPSLNQYIVYISQ